MSVKATHELLFRSAGCQPAVSPIANRRGVGTANGQRVGNPRYSRHGCLRYDRGATRGRAGGRRSFPRRFRVPMRGRKDVEALHEPRPLTPSLSPAGGEGVRRTGEGIAIGSWSQCVRKGEWRLSMNLKTLGLIPKSLRISGSWSQCATKKACRLSMNLNTLGFIL